MKFFIFILITLLGSCSQDNSNSASDKYMPGDNYIRVADSITQTRFDTCYAPNFDVLFESDTLFDTPADFPHAIDRENDWDYMGQRKIIFFKRNPIEAYRVRFYGTLFDHEITSVYYAEDGFKTVLTDSLSDLDERSRIENRFKSEILPVIHAYWENNACTTIKEKEIPVNW